MSSDDLPDWLPAWCRDQLGAEPVETLFARLMAALAGLTVAPPLPNPRWARWDHRIPGLWPAIDFLDERDQSVVPAFVLDRAERARKRLLTAGRTSSPGERLKDG